ncbi:hypothetical protein SBA4_4580038 [Candidatus Sulfopaludibacter sp. SbA4]|nr:hypothetical protein SBA4_4580038 [Candidatus Sulfopaludibacter sp. SbA4]
MIGVHRRPILFQALESYSRKPNACLLSTFFHLALESHLTQCLSLHYEENNPGFAKVLLGFRLADAQSDCRPLSAR